jgi:hypothetical protein
MILGCDPGSNFGMAVVDNRKLVAHKTVKANQAEAAIRQFHADYKFARAAVEMPQTGVLYSRHAAQVMSEAGRIKIAMNVGENVALAKRTIALLKSLGVEVVERSPRRALTKWSADYFCKIFQWAKRPPSEHARDAAVLALVEEGSNDFLLKKMSVKDRLRAGLLI